MYFVQHFPPVQLIVQLTVKSDVPQRQNPNYIHMHCNYYALINGIMHEFAGLAIILYDKHDLK